MTSDRLYLIERFTEAWETRDIEGVMQLMAPGCWFRSSIGPDPGRSYVGADEVRRGVTTFLSGAADPSVSSRVVDTLVAEDFAVVLWESSRLEGGEPRLEVVACDVFRFAGDRIKSKDTYRKLWSSG